MNYDAAAISRAQKGKELWLKRTSGKSRLHVLQLFLVHPEVVSQFVHDGQSDLLP